MAFIVKFSLYKDCFLTFLVSFFIFRRKLLSLTTHISPKGEKPIIYKLEEKIMTKFKKTLSLLLVAIFSIVLVACGEKNEPKKEEGKGTTYPITLKDSKDREVTIEKEPERIISVAPSITETIAALGKLDKLVGRTTYCDYPAEVSKIQEIGTLKEPNIEKIIELKPDVVIASTHFKDDVLKKLEDVGIKVAVINAPETFDGVFSIITDVAKVINANDQAEKLVADMKKKVDETTAKVKDKEKTSVYYMVGFGKGGDFTAGGDTFIGKAIEMAGGTNVAADVKGWKYSLEKLMEKNPDMIVVGKGRGAKEELPKVDGYKELKAVKENKIYEIDSNLLDRQGPRIAQGLEELAKIIHPEAFK